MTSAQRSAASLAAPDSFSSPRRRVVAELVTVGVGCMLFAAAGALNVEWQTRRFGLEDGRAHVVLIERAVLVVIAIAVVTVLRPLIGRWTTRVGGVEAIATCARIGLAVVLALVGSEVALRILGLPRPHGVNRTDALAEPDARHGWLFKASKSITIELGERPIRYDFDAERDRAPAVEAVSDPARPSLLFVGESIMSGHGLTYEESLPAIVGEALDLQVVNLAVDGYAADQAFLRLFDALPRFEHPVAIVTLFLPLMVNRIDRVDHQRITFDGLEVKLAPPGFVQSLRLTQTFSEWFDFHPEWAIQTAATVFQQTARLAKERNARAIFVTPYLGTDWPRRDGYLIQELLGRQGLTVVNPRFGFEPMPGDSHPNPASTRRLAEAVVAELRKELAGP